MGVNVPRTASWGLAQGRGAASPVPEVTRSHAVTAAAFPPGQTRVSRSSEEKLADPRPRRGQGSHALQHSGAIWEDGACVYRTTKGPVPSPPTQRFMHSLQVLVLERRESVPAP